MSPHHRRRKNAPNGDVRCTDAGTEGKRFAGLRRVIWHGERVWQDLVPLIALILAAVAVFGQESDLERQREGRSIAIEVLCGSTSGVQKAGELILKDELPNTERYRRPKTDADRERADAYARSYVRLISNEVLKVAGVEGKDVLDPDGSINCDRLKAAARATSDGQ